MRYSVNVVVWTSKYSLLFHVQNGDIAAIQSEIDTGADVEMATSGTTPHKPIFLAFLHDHYQVSVKELCVTKLFTWILI